MADRYRHKKDRPTNLMVVNALMWFEEPVDFGRAREIYRVHMVERFPPSMCNHAASALLMRCALIVSFLAGPEHRA